MVKVTSLPEGTNQQDNYLNVGLKITSSEGKPAYSFGMER